MDEMGLGLRVASSLAHHQLSNIDYEIRYFTITKCPFQFRETPFLTSSSTTWLSSGLFFSHDISHVTNILQPPQSRSIPLLICYSGSRRAFSTAAHHGCVSQFFDIRTRRLCTAETLVRES